MLLYVLALPSTAFAQDVAGFDAKGFRLATADGDRRAPLQFVRPGSIESFQFGIGGVAEYASRPLVFEAADGVRTVGLENVVALDLAGGIAPVRPLRIDLSMPVVLTSAGQRVGDPAGSSGGPTTGDLRAQLLVAPVMPGEAGGLGVGLLAALDLPTGSPDRYLGTDGPAALFGASATVEAKLLTVSWQLAGRLAPSTDATLRPAPTAGGDTVEARGAIGYLATDEVGVTLESWVAVPIDPVVMEAVGVPAELVASVRYVTPSGGHVIGALGTGLGLGAGASPLRLAVGGGFGGVGRTGPADGDGDGLVDKNESCPDAQETVNGYRDEDGCPDELPSVEFVAKEGDVDAETAKITLTRPDGTVVEGVGRVSVQGLPGESIAASAAAGACRIGTAASQIPQEGSLVIPVAITRHDGSVVVAVTDAVGRPLESATVRYLIDDETCQPADKTLRSGRGTHDVGVGPVRMFITASGYDVFQTTFDLVSGGRQMVEAKLNPTQVSVRGTELKLATPLVFVAGTATVSERSHSILQQVASTMLASELGKVQVVGFGEGKDAKKLAQQRADAIVAWLVGLGVAADRLVPVAKGALPSGQKDPIQFVITP